MKAYTVYSADGKIVRTGHCLDSVFALQAGEGETVVDGIVEQVVSEPILNYTAKRSAAYPGIGSQLDAIFKGLKSLNDSGTPLPQETVDWINSLQLVKDTFPKGGS